MKLNLFSLFLVVVGTHTVKAESIASIVNSNRAAEFIRCHILVSSTSKAGRPDIIKGSFYLSGDQKTALYAFKQKESRGFNNDKGENVFLVDEETNTFADWSVEGNAISTKFFKKSGGLKTAVGTAQISDVFKLQRVSGGMTSDPIVTIDKNKVAFTTCSSLSQAELLERLNASEHASSASSHESNNTTTKTPSSTGGAPATKKSTSGSGVN